MKADNEWKPEELLNSIETREQTREDKCRMLINERPVSFQIDTGSTVNLIPRKFADDIRPYNGKIIMWNINEIGTINEQTTTTLENPRTLQKTRQRFILYDGDRMPIISKRTSQEHGLIIINYKNSEQILKMEEDVIFNDELGTIQGKQHLNVDPEVVP